MAVFRSLHFLLVVVFSMIAVKGVAASPPTIKAAYWPSWAMNFPPSAIDTSFFTHIHYAFLMPNNVTFRFKVSKSEAVLLSDFTSTLHRKNPPVKTLFSIGGAGGGTDVIALMAAKASSRRRFIKSTIKVARKYKFDGLDLDWEYPNTPKEMNHLGCLLEEWRMAVEKEAQATGRQPLLITAAVYFAVDFFLDDVYRSYPVASIRKNLDWINAMCYDYHGTWDTTATGAHAALFDSKSNISTSYGVESWIKAGVPAKKVVMGLPLYGPTWKLEKPGLHGIGAPAVDVGPGEGTMTFSQVEDFNRENGATVVYDAATVSTYSYVGTSWIGYDDATSITVKIGFARAHGLSGYFFWAVNGDKDWMISRQVQNNSLDVQRSIESELTNLYINTHQLLLHIQSFNCLTMAAIKPALLLLLAIFMTIAIHRTSPSPSGIKSGYWPSYTASSLPISAIDTSLFTHLSYAFLLPVRLVVSKSEDAMLSQFTSTLHSQNPPVKALLSIAGGQDSTTLSQMSAQVSSRRDFPENQAEMDNFGRLLAVAIDKEARSTGNPPLLLTAATYFAAKFLPLRFPSSQVSTNVGVKLWIKAGIANVWTYMEAQDPELHGIGAPAIGVGPGDGQMTYSEVDDFNRNGRCMLLWCMTRILYPRILMLRIHGLDTTIQRRLRRR
ncbi:hypothetical protein HHK36_013847 [Tetracentron sinense]|uniref:GH18 domain-containing protein n=1 Tax=Tetracentron sinense TaxID=13715 RepID=A0A835DDQ2_TETSI|nr:hypothetical protein HHK36_013847 [Tetracentron sinense]